MKFRDPETGKVFEDIKAAMDHFCYESHRECNKCAFRNKDCRNMWVCDHPSEAARLMGYEVIEDSSTEIDETPTNTPTGVDDTPTGSGNRPTEEDDMDRQDKPRLAEVLGVEVGKKFLILRSGIEFECVVGKNGMPLKNMWEALYAINHPESIIRVKRLTEPEIAIMRAMGAKWVSRNTLGLIRVDLWNVKPFKTSNEIYVAQGIDPIARVKVELFPSVKQGECIGLEEER